MRIVAWACALSVVDVVAWVIIGMRWHRSATHSVDLSYLAAFTYGGCILGFIWVGAIAVWSLRRKDPF